MEDEKLCECCEKEEVQWELKDSGDKSCIYKVCSCCLSRLTTYSLSPIQFKNLLKNGHTVDEFLLHEDFYDEDGNKLQPMLIKD